MSVELANSSAQATRRQAALIARAVLHARAELEMSQTVLAVRAGISRSALNQLEAGRNNGMKVSTLYSVSRGLGLSVGGLLDFCSHRCRVCRSILMAQKRGFG
jgi:transcriptional regulator with XRE-family HTH domain